MLERTLEYIAAFFKYPFFFLMPIFIMKTISKFLQPKHGKIYTVLRYVICWTAGSMVIFIGDMINILYTLPFFFIIIWISHSSPAAAKLSVSMVFFSLTMSMNALIDSTYITGNYPNLFKFVIWLSIWLICRKFLQSNRYELSVKMWTLIGVLALLPFAATVIRRNPYKLQLADYKGYHAVSNSTAVCVYKLPVSAFHRYGSGKK